MTAPKDGVTIPDEEKMLMKIEAVSFGFGGYQDVQFGLHLTFSGSGLGVGSTDAFWATEWSEYCKWSEASRIEFFGQLCMRIAEYCRQAKVQTVDELKGIPVEVTIEGGTLKSWRILTEVL